MNTTKTRDSRPSDHFTEDYYDQNEQSGDRLALHFYAGIIKKLCSHGTVYGYGCGTGHLTKILNEKFSMFAYDISNYAVEKITSLVPDAVVVNDTLSVPENSCDLIVSLHVLEHIKNLSETVKYIYSRLKKNGLFFFVVPNTEGLGHKIKKTEWFGFRDASHISLLNRKEWEDILENNNFSIKKVKGDGMWDVPYFKSVPIAIQKLIFFPTAAIQVFSRSLFLPPYMGECLVILAKKN